MFAVPNPDFDAWPAVDEDGGRPSDDGTYLLSWAHDDDLSVPGADAAAAAAVAADAVSLVTSAEGGSKTSLPAASPPPSPIGVDAAGVAAGADLSAAGGDAGLDLAADLRAYTMEGGEVAVATDTTIAPMATDVPDTDGSVSTDSDGASAGGRGGGFGAAALGSAVAQPPLQSIAPAGAPPASPPGPAVGPTAVVPMAASPGIGGGGGGAGPRKKGPPAAGPGGRRSPGGRRRLLSRSEMDPEVLARVARDGVRTLEELTHDDLRRYTRNQLRAYCRIYGACSGYLPPSSYHLYPPLGSQHLAPHRHVGELPSQWRPVLTTFIRFHSSPRFSISCFGVAVGPWVFCASRLFPLPRHQAGGQAAARVADGHPPRGLSPS